MKDDLKFREVQHFRQLWIVILVIIITGFSWYAFVQQIIRGQQVGTHPASDSWMWVIWIVFGIILPLFFYFVKLITEITDKHLKISFWPIHRRIIALESIKTFKACEYNPIIEYGGWGIRWNRKKGMAYTVSGIYGVYIELTNGKKLLIGSQCSEKLALNIAEAKEEKGEKGV
jgi:hypothetical protein